MQPLVGRATVFEMLAELGPAGSEENALAHLAALCGLVAPEVTPRELPPLPSFTLPDLPSVPRTEAPAELPTAPPAQAKFVRVHRYDRVKEEERKVDVPSEVALARALGAEDFGAPQKETARPPSAHLIRTIHVGSEVQGICLLPNGDVVSGSEDGVLRSWDPLTGNPRHGILTGASSLQAVAALPSGNRVISASGGGSLKVWDLDSLSSVRAFYGHEGPIWDVVVLPDGKRAISCAGDSTLRVWDLDSGEWLAILQGHTGRVTSVVVSSDGRYAASGAYDHSVKVWNLESNELVASYKSSDSIQGLAAFAGNNHFISFCTNYLNLIEFGPHRETRSIKAPRGGVSACALHPDGHNLVIGTLEGSLRILDIRGGERAAIAEAHPDSIRAIAIFPDGRRVATGGDDGTIRLWDLSEFLTPQPVPGQPRNWAVPVLFDSHGVPEPPPVAVEPTKIPLSPWSRLDPFLRKALGRSGAARAIDVPRVIRGLANAEPMKRLPRRMRRGWAPHATILIDRDPALTPFWDDQSALLQRLRRQRGRAGLTELIVDDPQGEAWDVVRNAPSMAHRQSRERSAPVLLLGDCGFLGGETDRARDWRELGVQLRRNGARTVALAPCPRDRWPVDPFAAWLVACWDRDARFPVVDDRSPEGGFGPGSLKGDAPSTAADGADNLLTLLACAVRIEPGLLRAARLLLRRDGANVGTEADAWSHAWVGATSPTAVALDPQQARELRVQDLRRLPLARPETIHQDLPKLIAHHHAVHSPTILIEERLNLLLARGNQPNDPDRAALMDGIARLIKSLMTDGMTDGRAAWIVRVADRLSVEQRKSVPLLAAAYWLALARLGRPRDTEPLPEGWEEKDISWLRGGETIRATVWQCAWDGKIVFDLLNPNYGLGVGAARLGSRVFEVNTRTGTLRLESAPTEGKPRVARIQQVPANLNNVNLDLTFPIKISNEWETWHLEEITRPEWASAIGRDKYGLWADLEVEGVLHRMRWVNPGSFLMGSPVDEPERVEEELLHRATLTQGFWLGEGQCTQALWKAVMGERNPSRFKGDDLPVESVTWSECGLFLRRLRGLFPRPGPYQDPPSFSLPTEAQWEYACRAGTTGPFHFGKSIDVNQSNFDGSRPYQGVHPDIHRGRTAPAWVFPPNRWGLRSMHGNVWEWCSDWYGEYSQAQEEDPTGPASGSLHVVRGGGWLSPATRCRSAYREVPMGGDNERDPNIGFRILIAYREPALPPRPPWASAIGRDKYGLWAELEVAGVVQRMRWINPGSFLMGSPEDEPGRLDGEKRHRVTLTKGYWLADTPCTQAFWLAVMGRKNPARFQSPDRPVEQVSWKDCEEFLKRLPGLGEAGMRWALPSEAQWEYACRAGSEAAWCFGDDEAMLKDHAWYGENSGGETRPVGLLKRNAWGLADMHGNVWEWCADWYGDYGADEEVDPTGPVSGDSRVIRGGSWDSPAQGCRSACRDWNGPDDRFNDLGFRFAQVGGAE